MANSKLLLILLVAVTVSLVASRPVFKRSQVSTHVWSGFQLWRRHHQDDLFVSKLIEVRFGYAFPLSLHHKFKEIKDI